MDSKMKRAVVPVGLLLMMASLWGCAAHRGSVGPVAHSRALTKEDVVNMATSDIGDQVIIAQIEATGSGFDLSVSDVIELKNAGVSEKVIEHMIGTGKEQDGKAHSRWYVHYPYYYPMHTYYPRVRIVYLGDSRWHYHPRRDGRRGVWIKARPR